MAAEVSEVNRVRGPVRGRSWSAARLVLLVMLLLAFGLRVYHLDFQSLWSDEGISLLRADLPLGEMLRTMPVEHAPGYFMLLHFWQGMAGTSDFALRFLSLWPSVLVIAIAYRLGADLGSPGVGLVGALFLATSMFQVWYAQEARMYSWVLVTSLGATWLLGRILVCRPDGRSNAGRHPSAGHHRKPGSMYWTAWVGYVLLCAATIYLHHYGFLVPLAHAIFAVLWLWTTRDLRAFLFWVAAGCAAFLLYLPWLSRFLGIFSFSGWRQPVDPWQLPLRYLTAYTAGDAMPLPWRAWLPWVYLSLALVGIAAWWRRRRLAMLLLLTNAVVPLAGALALAVRQPDFHERYTIMVSAPLLLLSAAGLIALVHGWRGPASHERVVRLAPAIAVALLLTCAVGTNMLALQRLYTDSRLHKPDYRGAALRIQQLEKPGDVILVDGPDPQKVFLHYYRGPAKVFDLRGLQGVGDAEVDAKLTDAIHGAGRAWGLLYFHPPGPVQAWLARHGWPAGETVHNDIILTLYGLPGLPAEQPVPSTGSGQALAEPRGPGAGCTVREPARVAFGSALVLTEAVVESDACEGEKVTAHAGDLLRITTLWKVAAATPPALKFSLRLQDDAGRVWLAEDYVPQDGFAPTERWPVGQPSFDRHGLLLPADLPPGPYRVTLRLYDPATAIPVNPSRSFVGSEGQVEDGQDVSLAELTVLPAVTAPDPTSLPITKRVDTALNEELALLGLDVAPQPLSPGQPGSLSAWWRVIRRPTQPYDVQLELLDRKGDAIARQLYPVSFAPTDSWVPGQIVHERYPILMDPAAGGGEYRLTLALADAGSAQGDLSTGSGQGSRLLTKPLSVARVIVKARPRSYKLPHVSHPVQATLGGTIALLGYDLAPPPSGEPDGEFALTLYWQARQRVKDRYKVFVHLLDNQGRIAAQSDAFPAGGTAPTESWLPGEIVADKHILRIPAAGDYRLLVGLYDPVGGQRPPVVDAAGQQIPDGAIPLQEVEVTG